jgi:error-prone DNA polymerase
MGLRFVKGLGEGDCRRILKAREMGLRSIPDFIERIGLNEGTLEALAESGALSCFDLDRREALWEVSGAGRRRANRRDPSTENGASVPFSQLSLTLPVSEALPAFPSLSTLETIGWDYSTTAHSTLGHLLEPLREELTRKGLPDARGLASQPDGSRVSYAGMVICRQRPSTANGVVFMTLEDESGFVNLVVWEKVFQKFRTLFLTTSFLGVTGKIQAKEGVVHLVVESCWTPELSWEPETVESRDFH